MEKKQIFKLILIIIWMFVIFNFSAEDSKKSSDTSGRLIIKIAEIIKQEKLTEKEKEFLINDCMFYIRKAAHFTLYFILGLLSILLLKDKYGLGATTYIYTIIFCFIYACSDEIHQVFVPGRHGSFIDVLIDTSGTLLSIFTVYFFIFFKRKYITKK